METPNDPRRKSRLKEIRDWVVSLFIAVVISLLIQNYAFAQIKVEQHSMENTILEGQRLIENKFLFHFMNPQRGDIVIIAGPESEKRLIKRVIGLPGDTINFSDGNVIINGAKLIEPYAKGKTYPQTVQMPVTVPLNYLFVMGDNREVSSDSRSLGFIKFSSIEGKAVFRLWPLDKITYIE